MWADSPTLRLITFSCLIGFVMFCISYSFVVWKRRNRTTKDASNFFLRYRGWFIGSVVAGGILMAVAAAVREAVSTEATMLTKKFFVARSAEDMYATQIVQEGPVKQGDVLVKFISAKVNAELEEAQNKLKLLEAEQKALPLQPLPLDSELIRRHQNAEAAKRGLSDSQNVVLTALESAVRELRQQIDMKQETLTKTIGELEVNTKELRQAEERLRISKAQLDRETLLENRGSLLTSEIDERRKEVATATAEHAKQISRSVNLTAQKKQLDEMIKELQTLEKSQTQKLKAEHTRVQNDLAKANTESSEFAAKLQIDTQRASKVRASEIEQMNYKVAGTRAVVKGLQDRLELRAPFDGRVFYAHTSGASTPANTPIVVLGPEDGFRTQVRLLASQLEALKSATDVTIDVGDSQLSRVFPAKFRQAIDLPSEPNYVIAELDTNPSAEAVKVMAEETRLKARLSWRFPIWTFWPFKVGFILVGLGLLGYFLGTLNMATGNASADTTTEARKPAAAPQALPTPIAVSVPPAEPAAPILATSFIPYTPKTPTPHKTHEAMPAVAETRRIIVPATISGGTGRESLYLGDLTAKVAKASEETVITARPADQTVMVPVNVESDTKLLPQIRDLVKQDPIVVGPSESSKLLEILAIRLREAIHREYLERDLIESAEWAFEHHGQRAIRVFRQVFRDDNRYVPHMRTLFAGLESPLPQGQTAAIIEQRELVRRTGKILEAIGARFLSPVSVA